MPSNLESQLRAVYRSEADGQDDHRRAHEDEVVAAFSRRAPAARSARRWMPSRLALAGVLGTAVAVGACALPAEYPVSLGYGFEITVDASSMDLDSVDPEAVARSVGSWPSAERVEIRIGHSIDTTTDDQGHEYVEEQLQMQLFVFGGAMDADAMWESLQADFPALADATIENVPLAGTVRGTIGGKLTHEWFDVTLDRHGVEEAERQIMAELVAQGISPENATIDIQDSTDADGNRRIEVRVEAEK